LENFARETARQTSERATRRLNRMFGALSATNEAILRAKTEQELYQLVCDASVHGGKSLATFVLLKEQDSHWLKPVAGTGENLEIVARTHYSVDPENPYGCGISGEVFRSQKPHVERDLARHTRGTPWEQANINTGVAACIAAPLIRHGQSIGVILSFLSPSWAKDEEVVALMLRIAENVCFAIDNFDREAEKPPKKTAWRACMQRSARPTRQSCVLARGPSCSTSSAKRRRKAPSSPQSPSRSSTTRRGCSRSLRATGPMRIQCALSSSRPRTRCPRGGG
jgi:transcriptional regulator with GAF, ATPase, and Fis domain